MAEPRPDAAEPAPADRPTVTATPPPRAEFVLGPRAPEERPPARSKRVRGKDRGLLAFLRELPVLILLAFALALVLKTFVVQAFYIPSGSMEPTLMPGDRVLVNKVLYQPHRGDIVVFEDPSGHRQDRGIVGGFLHWLSEGLGFARPPNEDFIKRVIGLPGETVELRDGHLYVDGELVPQPYLKGPPDTRPYGPKTVPPDSVFVLGDNRLYSNDSRFGLGFVPIDKIVGKAFVTIWPPSRIGWLH
ncbi:MAG TPA: signal peptidase I [Actinomycetota bacterium]|nr:signal peptidase I [Actinomycetota bacterium]